MQTDVKLTLYVI